MKQLKYIFLTVFLLVPVLSFAQMPRWSMLEYKHSSGPVSPEYQYNYTVVISEDGSSKLSYTNSDGTKEWDYKISSNKKGMKKLKKALNRSKVFEVSSDEMKSTEQMIGGKNSELTITLWQDPTLDSMPEMINVPSQVKSEYKEGIDNLYSTIVALIPQNIKTEAGIE